MAGPSTPLPVHRLVIVARDHQDVLAQLQARYLGLNVPVIVDRRQQERRTRVVLAVVERRRRQRRRRPTLAEEGLWTMGHYFVARGTAAS